MNTNTLKNLLLSLCLGSIVAIVVNMRIATSIKFSTTAFALGFFVFSSTFLVKPIKERQRGN